MGPRLLYSLDEKTLPDSVGGKVTGLRELRRLHLRVPATWVVSFDGYRRYLADDETVLPELAQELGAALGSSTTYAVRSSANVEDGSHRTFAGQFKTVLDVRGVENVMRAIWSVWATARSEAVTSYLRRTGHAVEGLEMAVIVQEMVQSQVAGVAFSRNPVTGQDEVVIEAVRGKGTALVQDGVTPLVWVRRSGRWVNKPPLDSVDMPEPVTAMVGGVADRTRRIAGKLGTDVDLEWAWDGDEVYWLQVRRATTIEKRRVWSNAIAKEMLPGMTKPLVWSVNVPQTNGAWVGLISEVTGKSDIDPLSLARQFHYRTYFDTGAFGRIFESLGMPPDSLDRMVGVTRDSGAKPHMMPGPQALRHVPRMLRFGGRLLAVQRRVDRMLERARQAYGGLSAVAFDDLDGPAVVRNLDAVVQVHREVIYYNIVVPLLLRAYEALLGKGLRRVGYDISALDLVGDIDGIEQYDLPGRIAELSAMFRKLDLGLQERIRRASFAEFQAIETVEAFQEGVTRLLEEFGHLSNSVTDFSNVTWREQPKMVLQMIADYPAPALGKPQRMRFDELRLRGLRRRWLTLVYRRTLALRLLRDATSAVYTWGMGLIRGCFLTLGEHLVTSDQLSERDDVFYLYEHEVRQWIGGEWTGEALATLADRRKREMEESRDAELPPIIYGDDPPPTVPKARQSLQGVPTSPGYYTGPAKVIRGITEFSKLATGDVLVIPYSDVAWTPLFARAGAVVAESGGMLSHSSIIAREYGIPAVVSCEGALALSEPAILTVNGYTGEVVLHQEGISCES